MVGLEIARRLQVKSTHDQAKIYIHAWVWKDVRQSKIASKNVVAKY